MKKSKSPYHIRTNPLIFTKNVKRKRRKLKLRKGWSKFIADVISTAKAKGRKLEKTEIPSFYRNVRRSAKAVKPPFSPTLNFLFADDQAFSKEKPVIPDDGVFKIPNPFSLTSNYQESFLFLKSLFFALRYDLVEEVILDYKDCQRIDVDASVCMDVVLRDFIKFYENCWIKGMNTKLVKILPKNFDKEAIQKILFSVGAYKNLKNIEIKYPDILSFPLIVGNNFSKTKGRDKEIEVTKMVDYILECLSRMHQPPLTWEAEDNLSKVIGEVIVNAAEHSGEKFRYAIGYFQESKNDTKHIGTFNLTIFDFGRTIYQNFKKPESGNLEVVARMKDLSQQYTTRRLFKEKEFEEETLWTLYSLQEGVTSVVDAKRGNGSIHFIESFFRLKGDMAHDNSSFLTIMSGNTRITFDGTYQICEKPRGKECRLYKMMTFNNSGAIEDAPDKKFVTFADNFFPGTMIVAKICINNDNIEGDRND